MISLIFFFFSDCAVLGCRLVVILDDLLWVLTDDQLKAALHFADSLSGLLKRATEETQKVKGARKLQVGQEHCDQSFQSKYEKCVINLQRRARRRGRRKKRNARKGRKDLVC